MKLRLSEQQWEFVKKLGIKDKDYTEKEIDDFVIEVISDCLMTRGFNLGQEGVNTTGAMCESVIDEIEAQR